MSILAVALPTPAPQAVVNEITGLFSGGWSTLFQALLFIAIGILIIRILSVILVRVLGLTKLPKALIKVTVRLLDAGLWLLLSIAVMQMLGLTNVALAISGAFAVFALGLSSGLSATVADTISGLNLARDRHFRIGDKVQVGDRKTEGVIIDMDMRKSRIKDADGKIHVVPNGLIDKNEFVLLERAGQTNKAATREVVRRPSIRTRVAKTATIQSRKGA